VILGLGAATTPGGVATDKVRGEAYGLLVATRSATVGKVPWVVLPPQGGIAQREVWRLIMPNTVQSDVISTGSVGPTSAGSQSSATVEDLNILDGLVLADLAVAMSSSTSDGTMASSSDEGTTLINLTVDGISLGDFTPAPNTIISVPDVGAVILNDQISGGDGVQSSSLTVHLIHVLLTGQERGDIIIASAHSDVNFTGGRVNPVPRPDGRGIRKSASRPRHVPPRLHRRGFPWYGAKSTDFMTGAGRLGTGENIAIFGVQGSIRNGARGGQLQYTDHAAGLNIQSTSITNFAVTSHPCMTMSGIARVNNQDGYTFTISQACDFGEPGVGHDTLAISVNGPNVSYHRFGVLTGGNLQLHPM